jgi:hypothetical protein
MPKHAPKVKDYTDNPSGLMREEVRVQTGCQENMISLYKKLFYKCSFMADLDRFKIIVIFRGKKVGWGVSIKEVLRHGGKLVLVEKEKKAIIVVSVF